MAANRRDEWTHSGTCLCYHDNQCPRPTRFYPRYLQKRNPGAFVPTTWDRDSSNAGSLDRHGNRCQCLPRATSFGDLVTGSVQFTKSSSLVSLSPEVISVQPTVWKSSSMWSLPAENAVTMATVNSDPGFGQEVRAYKWQPSYSSGSGVSPYGGEGRGKYAAGKTGTGLEFARERESTGLSYSRLLKKMGKAGRWLRKLGQRHGDGAPRKKDKKEELYGRAKSVQDINSKVAEQVESFYGMSLNGQSGGVDVEWEESTSSGASSVDFGEFSDQRTYSLPSLKDKRSDAGVTKCHTKPLSRSVDGLLCDDGLKRTTELCPSDARGKHGKVSAKD